MKKIQMKGFYKIIIFLSVIALFSSSTIYSLPVFADDLKNEHGPPSIEFKPSTPGKPSGIIPGQYIVVLNEGVEPDEIASFHGLSAFHKYEHAFNGFAVRASAQQVEELKNDSRVLFVEPDHYVEAVGQILPTGIDRIEVDKNLIAKIDGVDQRVDIDIAIVDTGILLDHPDLNVVNSHSVFPGKTGNDLNGHGTHVAGTAAAIDNNSYVVGVAPGARLWAVQVLDETGNGSLSGVVDGLDYVTAHADEIEVANLSLRAITNSNALHIAVIGAVNNGVVVVVAAGNDGIDITYDGIYGNDCPFFCADVIPAAYSEAMTISALADGDGIYGGSGPLTRGGPDDSVANFTNYSLFEFIANPVTSPGKGIDLILPGANINSTFVFTGGFNGWAIGSGTSMASPHAAGLVALYIAEHGRDVNGDSLVNAGDVYAIRQALIDNAISQNDPKGLAILNDPDGNEEKLGWAEQDIVDTTAPSVSSAETASTTSIELTMSEDVVDNSATPSDFTVSGAASLLTVTSLSVSANTVTLNLSASLVDSDSITVSYAQTSGSVDDLAGNSLVDFASQPVTNNLDTTPPTITNVQHSATETSATITWDTDESSNSVVRFGTSTPPATTESDLTLTTSHSITLSGLLPNTTYFYEVESTDSSANVAADNNSGSYYQFTTSAVPTTEMHVENIDMSAKMKGKSHKSEIYTTVTILDADGSPVSGAQVVLNLVGTDGSNDILSGTTDSQGNVQLTFSQAQVGNTYTATVVNLLKSGWTYDSSSNVETSDSITI